MVRTIGVIALWVCGVLAGATVLAGCGGSELRTGEQASEFIRDIARGGSIDNWTHEANAVHIADTAWYNQEEIRALGTRLREEGVEWACNTAEQVDNAVKVAEGFGLEISVEERESIALAAELEGVQAPEVNSLISEVLSLGHSEALETVNAACRAAKEL